MERNLAVTEAIETACYLFSRGDAQAIQKFLDVVRDEIAIHNAASPMNKQVSIEAK